MLVCSISMGVDHCRLHAWTAGAWRTAPGRCMRATRPLFRIAAGPTHRRVVATQTPAVGPDKPVHGKDRPIRIRLSRE
jgi:hypothetical protein